MNILIAGASGFIGQALVQALQLDHQVSTLGRDKRQQARVFTGKVTMYEWSELSQIDARQFTAVINLCGYNIAASRWNKAVKQKIIDSRVKTSQTLLNWLIEHQARPHFICANAVGIYGLQDNGDLSAVDEDSPIQLPHDFLSDIGLQWQAALQPGIDYGMAVTTTRFGVVLKKGQGMLGKLAPSFYMGLGHIIGSGTQIISWIHLDDVVQALLFLLKRPALTGAFNLCAPEPVSQSQFAHILAASMGRPLWLKLPAGLIQWLFGEMGECLLLKGQRVLPKRLLAAGYVFDYPQLAKALAHEYE